MKNETFNEPSIDEANRTAGEIQDNSLDDVSRIFDEDSSSSEFVSDEDTSLESEEDVSDVASIVEEGEKRTYEKRPIDVLAAEFAIDMYHYAASIKQNGHATLSDLIFKDVMEIYLSANMASNAIGRDKFIACLENAYYASGRVIEYLHFAALISATDYNQTELLDKADRIHRIYAVSIKTATSKRGKKEKVYM